MKTPKITYEKVYHGPASYPSTVPNKCNHAIGVLHEDYEHSEIYNLQSIKEKEKELCKNIHDWQPFKFCPNCGEENIHDFEFENEE